MSNSDLSKISDSLTLSEWSLAFKNFVATNTKQKLWYTARILFQQKFHKKLYHLKGIPNLGVWWKNDPLDFWSWTKKSDFKYG